MGGDRVRSALCELESTCVAVSGEILMLCGWILAKPTDF